MKHQGKAAKAALRIILLSLLALAVLAGAGLVATLIGHLLAALTAGLLVLWLLFCLFVFYFFRDPTPATPQDPGLVVAPAHGTVDVIEEHTEPDFIQGRCRRVSIFLSVFDVHVQNAPVTGRVAFVRHYPGQFLNAMRADCGLHNENVLLGFEASDPKGARIGARLIAGLIARRIIPWVKAGEDIARGERISLIQFGSRCDVYLPLDYEVCVKLGDKTVGGETLLARAPRS